MAIKIDRVLDFCFIYTIVCDIYRVPETLLSPVLKMIGAIQPAPGGVFDWNDCADVFD